MAVMVTCVKCGNRFEPENSDAEAMAEATVAFPDSDLSRGGMVCDDCYEQFQAWAKTHGLTGKLSDDKAKLDTLTKKR